MTTPTSPINLLGLDRKALEAFFIGVGEKPYRAQQLLKWIHYHGQHDFDEMTNIKKTLRDTLKKVASLTLPEVLHEQCSADGTYKWLLKLADGNCIETVYIPETARGTLCISSQVGCILNCDFCSTGKQGFNRNLTSAEIMSQLWIAVRRLSKENKVHDHSITNVVMMGMGEPLLNLDNVLPALNLMLDDYAYGLSKYRVTVSTAGVIPGMHKLREASEVALAVSLHAPNNALRNEIVPLNKKYPLEELMAVCKDYFKNEKRRSITMEYVMLNNVNDSVMHAKQLVKLMEGVPVKINLIPFNPFPLTDYTRSSPENIDRFRTILQKAGLNTTVRKTRGDAIDAACGQLVGQVKDRTKRHERYLKGQTKKVVGVSS